MKTLNCILKKPFIKEFSLSDFAINLFLFNCIFDPGNGLFHTKQITFFFALITNIKKINNRNYFPIFNFLIFYIAFFISTILMIVRKINYDNNFLNMYLTTFLLLLIFFIDNRKINVLKGFSFACFFVSLLTIIFSVIIILVPVSALVIIENEKLQNIFMFAEHKKFLWWWISGVFHKASPLIIIQLGYEFYSFIKNKIKKHLFFSFFYSVTMFFSGTRANLLATFLVLFLIYIYDLFYNKKRIYKSAIFIFIFLVCTVSAIFLLITVKNSSSDMKDAHMVSYNILFSENPFYILLGQGPGSWFYDIGWKRLCTNTELSYFELLRMFGVFFSIIIICLYAYPFFYFVKNRNFFTFSISISYLAYLFIAGTNPLLIGPTGFIAFWYSNYLLEKGDVYDDFNSNGNL